MRFDYNMIFFGTNNLSKVHKFYHEILGFTVFMDQGICRIYNIPGGGKIGFCSHIATSSNDPIITLVTNDVDEVYKLFKKKNIKCYDKPKVNNRFKLYHFFAEDYDGHRVEIQRFL